MMSLKDSAVKPASQSETKSHSAVGAPREGQAPIAELSLSKRHALVSCFNAGGLNKKDGAWHVWFQQETRLSPWIDVGEAVHGPKAGRREGAEVMTASVRADAKTFSDISLS
jgi:hypothetical protein